MKASEQTAKGRSGAKHLAHFRGGEFSWEYPTLTPPEFTAVEIDGSL